MRHLCLAAALAAALACAAATRSAPERAPHPYDADPRWSPDSRLIAFNRDEELWVMRPNGTRAFAVAASNDWAWMPDGSLVYAYRGRLYRVDPLGPGVATRLTPGRACDSNPAVSRDGEIAFHRGPRRRDGLCGRGDLWLVARDGANPRQLTRSAADDRSPSWSPDGASLAYSACAARCRIVAARADGSSFRFLTGKGDSARPRWSPAGAWIAFLRAPRSIDAGYAKLFLVRPDGSGLRREQPAREWELHYGETQGFDWSPDGRSLVYAADAGPGGSKLLFVANGSGRKPRPLIRSAPGRYASDDDFPAWSPDGRTIAFLRYDYAPDGGAYGAIFSVRSNGLGLRRLTGRRALRRGS
jgi:Tol biopolymer transport system component